MSSIWTDLRMGLRVLRRARGFALTAIVTLGLGIAGVALMFSLAGSLLFPDLPMPEADRLVLIGDHERGGEAGNSGYATFDDWRNRNSTLESLAAVGSWAPTLLQGDEALRLVGVRMSWEGLPMLGARALHGQVFGEDEDHPERRRVVVLSHRLWRDRFDSDPDVVGRAIDLAGREYRVLGVLDPLYRPLLSSHLFAEPDIYAPLAYRSEQPWACRSCQHLKVFGRLAQGQSPDSAQADLETIQTDLHERFPDDYANAQIAVLPFRDALVVNARPVIRGLAFAVGALLLVACANVALLQLARSRSRRTDLSVRVAMGASARRLMQQALLESSILWAAGAAFGLACAVSLLPVVAALMPTEIQPSEALAIDLRILLTSLGATFIATVGCGLIPASSTLRRALHTGLRGDRRATSQTLGRRLLVTANVALAFALVVGSGLMMHTVTRLLEQGAGFETSGLVAGHVSMLGARYEDDTEVHAIMMRLVEELEASPGIERAAIASQLPLAGNFDGRGVDVEGRDTGRAEDEVSLQRYSVTDGYLDVTGLPLVRGRWFNGDDTAGAPHVVLVSESAVPLLAPDGGDAIGRRIRFGGSDEWWEVVGVVGDVRHEELGGRVLPAVYQTQRQWTDRYLAMVVRAEASVDEASIATQMEKAVHANAPGVPVFDVASLNHLALESAGRQRFTAGVLAAFSFTALFLACIGLYGVVSFLVEQRRREIGLRVALGAMRGQVVQWVLRQGMQMVFAGLALGALLAIVGSRAISTLLFETDPLEVAIYGRTLLVLIAVGLLAHAIPVLRALRVEPSDELRRP